MLESHSGVPLIKHLKAVASNCLEIARKNSTDFGFSQKTKETLVYICGVFHDLGKATSYFQDYLKNPEAEHSSLKNHALPSAVFVFYVVQRFTETLATDEKELGYFMASTCFTIVKRHHGHLKDFNNEISIEDKYDNLQKQYDAISPVEAQNIIDKCISEHKLSIDWNRFVSWFSSGGFKRDANIAYLDFELDQFDNWEMDQKSSAYFFFLWMFSTLLYSDKSDVILAGAFPILPLPRIRYLDEYRKKNGFNKPTSQINQLKNEAYYSVLDRLNQKFDPKQKLYSITLPTGLGKTLASFGAALMLKSMANLKEGRIIVAIPFTSIIDQNYKVYEEVLNNPDSNMLLKHHHLAELQYKDGEDSFRSSEESQYLIETWQSSVVVTTFVQLLECLITNDKGKLLKFHSLSNSIILLDEVQQIPYQLWQTVRQAFFTTTEQLNCYVILMSATQPLIFHPGEEIKELVADYQKYFSFFNRTKLINKTAKSIPLQVFIDEVLVYIKESPNKDILIILNTKKTTLTCFRELRKVLPENTELRYLTTLITPYERKKIISELGNRNPNKQYIIVSTQLVEAGVDISVDTVFRTLAPLDSIIQAAGRANRYGKKETASEVFLYKIDEQYPISCRLYGKELILKTELVLGDQVHIEEKEYLQIITEYFKQIQDLSNYSDKKLINDLLSLNFDQVGKFKLIEEVKSESMFVALDDNAKDVWKEFVRINEAKDLSDLDKRKLFSKFKPKFYDYVINIPIPYDKNCLEMPIEAYKGFYMYECNNMDNYDIYLYDQKNLAMNEGYIYKSLALISF